MLSSFLFLFARKTHGIVKDKHECTVKKVVTERHTQQCTVKKVVTERHTAMIILHFFSKFRRLG